MRSALSTLITFIPAFVVCTHPAWTQSNTLFTVVSPTAGQVFAPGATIPVTLQPANGVTLVAVSVVSAVGSASSGSASVSVVAAQDPFGPAVLAITGTASDTSFAEVDVAIDIESPKVVKSITVYPAAIELAAMGTSKYLPDLSSWALAVLGTLSDGTEHNITNSTKTSYASSNSLVANVDAMGNVTAEAPGSANIIIKNIGNGIQMPAIIQTPVTVNVFELRGDLDGDSDVDNDDIAVLEAALNTTATGPGDPRDLNNDGKINATDLSILQSLCSRKNCATE